MPGCTVRIGEPLFGVMADVHGKESGAQSPASSTPSGSPASARAFPRGAAPPDPRSGRTPGARLFRFLSVLALALLPGVFCFFAAAPAQAQNVWSARLTVADTFPGVPGYQIGCGSESGANPEETRCTSTSVLTNDSFSYDGETFRIDRMIFANDANSILHDGTDTEFSLHLDKAIPASMQNSLKLVVGNRKQEFWLSDARILGNRKVARWDNVSVQGWTVGATVPVSLVRAPPEAPGSLYWSITGRANGLHVGWRPVSGATGYDLHYTSAPKTGNGAVSDNAAARGSNPATSWVDARHRAPAGEDTSQQVITGLVDGREYRVRLRGKNDVGAGPWAHGTGTAGRKTIVLTPDADLLTGLEIKGVRADGTDTAVLPLQPALANVVGLGGPGLYAIRVPPDVKKVKIKVTFTTTASLGFNVFTHDATRGGGRIDQQGWGVSESGQTRELLLRPGSGVTRIRIDPAHNISGTYNIYAYHDNFADSANANLRTLQMNAGN